MGREEFIEILQRTLAGSLNSSTVNENIRYYQDYIDMELRSGQSEGDIITELGDPRLLAKSIIEAKKYEDSNSGHSVQPDYDDVYDEDGNNYEQGGRKNANIYQVPSWMVIVFVILLIFIILMVVGSFLSVFLPIIIPVTCVILIVNYIRKKR